MNSLTHYIATDGSIRRKERQAVKKVRTKPRRKGKRMEVKFKTEWGQKFPDGREVCDLRTLKGQREYHRRVDAMAERQDGGCKCGKRFLARGSGYGPGMSTPTFGHDIPRGMNGSTRDDRIIDENGVPMNHAECWDCNSAKASKRTHDFKKVVPAKEKR